MTIKLTSIPVNNPIEAFEFYTSILNFKKLMFVPEASLAIVVSPEDEKGTALMLEPNSNDLSKTFQKGAYEKGLPIIILGSDNVQQEYERLVALDVKFKKLPTKTDYGTLAVFDDTCGNYIQIHQND